MIILFVKSQFNLFDAPVHVAAHVRKDGVVVAPHMRIQKVTHKQPASHRSTKLDAFIARHGGAANLSSVLNGLNEHQRLALINQMAELGGKTPDEVSAMFPAPVAAPVVEMPPMAVTPEPDSDVARPTGHALIEHETKRRTLRGIVRKDLTEAEAKEIDAYTFKKNGGWFIREKYIQAANALDAAYTSGVINDEQHAFAREMAAKDGPEGAVAALTPPESAAEPADTAPVAETGPNEGERNAEGLVFRDGRWHRDEAEVATETAAPDPEANHEVEAAEDRVDLAEAMAENPHSEKSKRMLANAAQRHADAEDPKEPDADAPSSASYRYADTGYIAGSRKEMAAAQVIAKAKKDGARVYETAIDWDQLEANPREAKDLITKSNLFGQVDWDTLKAGGMEPGAGFLVDRIYAAIGQEPSEDKPQARRDYALGLQTLRDRMEGCTTADQVSKVLDNLREEFDGKILTAEESVRYQVLSKQGSAAWEEDRAIDEANSKLYRASNAASGEVSGLRYEIEKRVNRKWSPKPELAEQLAAATLVADAAQAAWSSDLHATRARRDELRDIRRDTHHAQQAITLMAYARNQLENPLHRAWNLMGERFVNVLRYRSYKGSDAFAKHVAVAKTGKITDWSWAEKETVRAPRISKESARFQLKIADNFERVGGRAVTPHSTMELKEMFGLRDVQSGNWVLRDVASAKFHTENCAAAFADLADLLGAPDKQISMNGRLAMAFGARGTGAKGFKDGSASAHYESVHRVINLTKMGGGGSLAHEWFHAMDNIAKEAEGMGQSGAYDYATSNPDILPSGELRDAFHALRGAMLDGVHQATETVTYNAHDVKVAAHNLGGRFVNGVGQKILAAGDVHAAVQSVDDYFKINTDAKLTPKTKKLARDWRKIAVAHYGGNADGGSVDVKGGPAMSAFAMGAAQLDQGGTAYWSQTMEMGARAFQSWVEDRLSGMGRRNDYLSVYADNKYHRDPLTGMEWKPYPEGAERERINAAFDQLFAAVGASGTLAKALALLDTDAGV